MSTHNKRIRVTITEEWQEAEPERGYPVHCNRTLYLQDLEPGKLDLKAVICATNGLAYEL